MKIIIAPDSFKGNMRSAEVCAVIQEAVLQELPGAEACAIPMADGGEGTVDAVVAATGGELRQAQVCGPLGTPVQAVYGILPDGSGILEMASASGIELVPEDRLNPMEATTYGTGELITRLLDDGCRSVVIGIGGSATVDGGVGMAQALGYRLLDARGQVIEARGGAMLDRIHTIDDTHADPRLKGVNVSVACDVTNPLAGPDGAAAVYGPQKGATPQMVEALDAGLVNLMERAGLPGAPGDGAAGGLGYGLRVFCSASICSGARLIAETAGLPEALNGADLLITGEGRTDGQTASGKLCAVLAEMARERGVRSLLVSGALMGDIDGLMTCFDFAFGISSGHGTLEDCIAHSRDDLRFTVRNAVRLLSA